MGLQFGLKEKVEGKNKMVKKKTKKIWNNILLALALLIVIATHIAILAMGIPQEQLGGHASLNLIAAGMIIVHVILEEFIIK